jgi:hypothetical protein
MCLMAVWGIPVAGAAEAREYRGCCDASAAAVLNDELLAVASDEENVLRLYRRDAGGLPVATVAAMAGSAFDTGRVEMDLEGAARVDDLVFWIGSHSRNSDGKARPARHALLATRVVGTGGTARLKPEGTPYRGLVAAMAATPELGRFQLSRAAARAGEAAGGLNIEALAAGSEGKLWIGFRNPVPDRKALLVPLLNPNDVIAGRAARFGSPVQLGLGGLGLRDSVTTGAGDRVLLLAGPAEGGGKHRLFVWTEGTTTVSEVAGAVPKGFQAEAVVMAGLADARQAEILSDEGGEKIGGVRCADLRDTTRRVFRAWPVAY